MTLKRKRSVACKLYVILDTQVCDHARLWDVMRVAVKSGVDIVQLRDKTGSAKETLAFARKIQAFLADRVPFIVNDRVDIAKLSGATGVHLGQEDIPIVEARRILGAKKIIGTSCQSLAHVHRAVKDGADNIGFGSVFKTKTKPERSPMDLDLLSSAMTLSEKIGLPAFAIGGITFKDVPLLKAHGVGRIAVCRDILLAEDVARTVRSFKTLLSERGS